MMSVLISFALTLSQDLHSKLEVTAKVLKDNQEASARELINQQAKLREVRVRLLLGMLCTALALCVGLD